MLFAGKASDAPKEPDEETPQPVNGMEMLHQEILLAVQMAGEGGFCEVDFAQIENSKEFTVWVNSPLVGDPQPYALRVKVTGWVENPVNLEKEDGSILEGGCKMFEADVLLSSLATAESENFAKKMFGMIFPDGSSMIVNSEPDSDRTSRFIFAMIALSGGPSPSN